MCGLLMAILFYYMFIHSLKEENLATLNSSSTAFQPIYAWLLTIFGRKILIITTVTLFALGNGVSSSAISKIMLLTGQII
jgi:hypothetical protein